MQTIGQMCGRVAHQYCTNTCCVCISPCSVNQSIINSPCLLTQVQLFSQAAFCVEELILLNPSSTSALLRYAHVQHGRGSIEALQIARTHYSTVVQLTEGTNAAALYGVCATTAALAAGKVNFVLCLSLNVQTMRGFGWYILMEIW